MSKVINVVVLGGLAFLGWKYFKKGSVADKLEIGFKSAKINKHLTDLLNTGIDIQLSLYNPTTTNIRFEKFYGNVYLNDKRISDIDPPPFTKVINIVPRTDSYIPLTLKIKNTSLVLEFFGRIMDYVKTKTFAIDGTIRLEGFIVAEGVKIPFNLTKEISEL